MAKAALAAIMTQTRKGRALTPMLSANATAIGVNSTATAAFERISVSRSVTP
ncbi:hypothetical protein D3C83_107990 [compost metagenome]